MALTTWNLTSEDLYALLSSLFPTAETDWSGHGKLPKPPFTVYLSLAPFNVKADNKVLGVISELMFYTNILHDIMSHRIQYQNNSKLKNTVRNNYRGFGELYRSYICGNIQKINSIILADKTHPLISPSLLDFINESARLKYCRINYSMKKVDI